MASSDYLERLAAYVPTPVAQAIYYHPDIPSAPVGRNFSGAVLFMDVSGFTSLTEKLAQAGAAGAEELTHLINRYFTHMISTIHDYHGQVAKFSGDALTVIFPTTDEVTLTQGVRYACECALTMQSQMFEFASLRTSRGTATLSMKVGIGAGELVESIVGGVLGRWEHLVAGDPIEQIAKAEHYARPGQTILSPEAWQLASFCLEGTPHPDAPAFIKLHRVRELLPLKTTPSINWSSLSSAQRLQAAEALKAYIPGTIRTRLDKQADWLSELRRMTIMFVNLWSFDHTHPLSRQHFHQFLTAVQKLLYSFEGTFNKVVVDDKGTILLLLFGAPPFSHEDDPTRAVACALELRDIAKSQNITHMSIGITEGTIFAGPVGAPNRREYTVLGDHVNLAARLMKYKGPGSIIISERIRDRAGPHFVTNSLGRVKLKGKTQTTPAHELVGEQDAQDEFMIRHLLNDTPLFGRFTELDEIRLVAEKAKAGQLQILFIEGELGVGKSRLSSEVVRDWVVSGCVGFGNKCVSYGRQIPYQAWREVLAAALGITPNLSPMAQLARIELALKEFAAPTGQADYWRMRLPLLAEAMGIESEDNEFTRELTGQLRRNNIFTLIQMILRQQAERRPLLVLLEDIQWADELSLALLEHLAIQLRDTPILLMLVHRPLENEQSQTVAAIKKHPYTHTLALPPLQPTDSREVLHHYLNGQSLQDATEDMLLNRSQGNPFFLKEIAQAVLDVIQLAVEDGRGETNDLPDLPASIQDVILARVDRLREESAKVTLKIASVLGNRFPRELLFQVHPMRQNAILDQLERLEAEKLLRLEAPGPKWEYVFYNEITQEVIYEGLLLSQRKQLHTSVAMALENLVPDAIESLAYHYSRSTMPEKALDYLHRVALKAKREYANHAAVNYYGQILACLTELPEYGLRSAAYWDVLMERAKLYQLIGERDLYAEDLGALGLVAEALQDEERRLTTLRHWVMMYSSVGDYMNAISFVEELVSRAEKIEAKQLLGDGHNLWGHLLFLQRDYEGAFLHLQLALLIAQEQQDEAAQADCLHSLGVIGQFQGDFEVALYFFQEAYFIRKSHTKPVPLASTLNQLGQVYHAMGHPMAALRAFSEAVSISQRVGDKMGETAHERNMGRVYLHLGHFERARRLFESARSSALTAHDEHAEALSLAQLGWLHFQLGDYESATLLLTQTIATARNVNDEWCLREAFYYSAYNAFAQGDDGIAETFVGQARALNQKLHQTSTLVLNDALSAQIRLKQGDIEGAQALIRQIEQYCAEKGTHGIDQPGHIYAVCHQIWEQTNQFEQAEVVLNHGLQYLHQQMGEIFDPALQEAFAHRVPAHQYLFHEGAA